MKNLLLLLLLLTGYQITTAQTIQQKLARAVQQFEADPQMKHAILGLCVVDAKTGKQVYAHHEQVGLAPASTQKLFTSMAALELLGADYRFKTELGYEGTIKANTLNGNFFVNAGGDPALGSWRWDATKEENVLNRMCNAIKKLSVTTITKPLTILNDSHEEESIPDGWIWQDIGNYYGAGASVFNWRENQFDLILRSGNTIGDAVEVAGTQPVLYNYRISSAAVAAAKGTGDNAFIYYSTNGFPAVVRGTIPAGEQAFRISGSLPDPFMQFAGSFTDVLNKNGITTNPVMVTGNSTIKQETGSGTIARNVIYTEWSPPLDSLNYYFLRRSVNLYGEAFVKTIAYEKTGKRSIDKGAELVKEFWSERGIDKAALHIVDGSGLSPQNRVTTDAEVKALQYARTRPWFNSFYDALPTYNGMKMKSGSIGGARAYAGYHTAKDGKEYIFSIIVNNYDGSSGAAVQKLYRVLNVLK